MMTELEYDATKIKIERENEEKLKHYPILQKQLDIAVKALELAKGFYGYCRMKGYTVALSHDFNDDYEKINNAIVNIKELNK